MIYEMLAVVLAGGLASRMVVVSGGPSPARPLLALPPGGGPRPIFYLARRSHAMKCDWLLVMEYCPWRWVELRWRMAKERAARAANAIICCMHLCCGPSQRHIILLRVHHKTPVDRKIHRCRFKIHRYRFLSTGAVWARRRELYKH